MLPQLSSASFRFNLVRGTATYLDASLQGSGYYVSSSNTLSFVTMLGLRSRTWRNYSSAFLAPATFGTANYSAASLNAFNNSLLFLGLMDSASSECTTQHS